MVGAYRQRRQGVCNPSPPWSAATLTCPGERLEKIGVPIDGNGTLTRRTVCSEDPGMVSGIPPGNVRRPSYPIVLITEPVRNENRE